MVGSPSSAIAAASSSEEVSSTGRRPMWSERAPTVSSAARMARAYTANTANMTVTVIGENPQRAW
ncbi:hypothetical protein [Frankia sp. CcWB2]